MTGKFDDKTFKVLIENSYEGVAIIGAEGETIYISPTMEKILGYSEKEIPKDNCFQLVHPDFIETAQNMFQNFISGAVLFQSVEIKMKHKNGNYIWVEANATNMLKNPEIEGIVINFRDINEKKQAEETLNFNAMVFDQISDLIVVTDMEGRVRYCNGAVLKTLKRERHEIIGNEVKFFGDNPQKGASQKEIAESVRNFELWEGEVINYDSRGNEIIMSARVQTVKDFSGKPVAMVGVSRNITEQKKDEQELLESEEKFRKLAESSSAGIFIRTGDKFQYVNNAMCLISGYSKDELMNIDMEKFIYPEYLNMMMDIWQKRVNGESVPDSYECRARKKGGGDVWVSLSGNMINFKGNKSLIGVVINITDRKNAELEKEKLSDQLMQSQKMESVGRLAGGVAHDFNNMLSVILGRAEIALNKVEPESKVSLDIKEIKAAAERSADLTSQLLAFARKQVVTPKVVSINAEINSFMNMLDRLIGEDVKLIFNGQKNLRNIMIDPSQLNQILTNLCINAKDAGAQRITIQTVNHDYNGTEIVMLKVADDGSGVDEKTRRMMFEPFFTTKELGKGTGLGLSTIYGIIKQNKGTVSVESEVGKGTEFNICFPAVKDKAALKKVEQKSDKSASSGGTILLVEDEETILDMTSMMLREFGYEVFAASTPGEALNIAVEIQGNIDLVLTDVVMPEMNGRNLVKTIMKYHPDIRSVFMSGYTADVIASRGVLDEDMNFLQKPFSMLKLKEKIKTVLGEK